MLNNTHKHMEKQEKLFTETEIFTTERPVKITETQEREFYRGVAETIIKYKWSISDVEDIVHDISNVSLNDIGFRIAQNLEGYGNDASYAFTTEFLEYLEHLSSEKNWILRANVEAWVAAHNPIPKYSKGQKLMIEITLNIEKRKGLPVFVTGFSEKQACYLIAEDKNRNGGTVIPYERVEANCIPFELNTQA